jgi:acetolactate synthase regulatory subunit
MDMKLSKSREVIWLVRGGRVRVVDTRNFQVHDLQGVDAQIWQWLGLGKSQRQITRLLAQLQRIDAATAAAQLDAVIEDWVEKQLLDNAS